MVKKSQSIIMKILNHVSNQASIKKEYSSFRRKCGFKPALSEQLFFKSCCAALIEDLGYVPPTYADEAAAYLRLHKNGALRAGVPTEKGREAH